MATSIRTFPTIAAIVTGSTFITVLIGHAQTTTQPARTTGTNAAAPATQAGMNAEREKIWNSPAMLRARAWLQDYCSKSAKITPEMARRYQQELQNMTPSQLELWLLKFNEEEEQRQQQNAFFEQANAAKLQQAMAIHRQQQQAYANINTEETESAQNEQQQINEQRANTEMNAQDRLYNMGPAPYWSGPGYGYGGVHYHYHLYP